MRVGAEFGRARMGSAPAAGTPSAVRSCVLIEVKRARKALSSAPPTTGANRPEKPKTRATPSPRAVVFCASAIVDAHPAPGVGEKHEGNATCSAATAALASVCTVPAAAANVLFWKPGLRPTLAGDGSSRLRSNAAPAYVFTSGT